MWQATSAFVKARPPSYLEAHSLLKHNHTKSHIQQHRARKASLAKLHQYRQVRKCLLNLVRISYNSLKLHYCLEISCYSLGISCYCLEVSWFAMCILLFVCLTITDCCCSRRQRKGNILFCKMIFLWNVTGISHSHLAKTLQGKKH